MLAGDGNTKLQIITLTGTSLEQADADQRPILFSPCCQLHQRETAD